MFRPRKSLSGIALVLGALMFVAGCEAQPLSEREKGTIGGGVLGAGAGALIGNAVGHPGAGALIGGGMGALGGAAIGNEMQNQRVQNEQTQSQMQQQQTELERQRRELEQMRRQQQTE